jgi:methylated-DNA-protein-cysteine methyltransferase-like protein
VHALVRRIPPGRVSTYGDLARALGHAGVARQVGFALANCPDDVPWHRVVNSQGAVSARADGVPSVKHVRRLRREKVAVRADGRVSDFVRLRWQPT